MDSVDLIPGPLATIKDWLRRKELAGFIILSVFKVTGSNGVTANRVEFRPRKFQETPDGPEVHKLEKTEEADQREEIVTILKGNKSPITFTTIVIKEDGADMLDVDVFICRPDNGAWANSLVPANISVTALNIPWKEGKWSNLDFKGLQDKRLLSFTHPNGGPDVVAAVTDADIDTDGPGGSKGKDRFWSPNTSLRDHAGNSCDSRVFRGVVTPPALRQKYGIAIGDLAWVSLGDKAFGAQVYDSGPETKIGEISFGLAVALGIYPDREPATEARAATQGNSVKNLVTVFFPKSGHGKAMAAEDIEAGAQACMRLWLGDKMGIQPDEKVLFTDVSAAAGTWDAFVASLNLPAPFKGSDLLVKTSNSPNTPPPKALWHNIVPTLAVLIAVQKKFGKPLNFHSTYRSLAYNNAVGGAKRSQHLAFRAVDFSIKDESPSEVAEFARTLRGQPLSTVLPGLTISNAIPGMTTPPPLDLAKLNVKANASGGTDFEFHGGIQDYPTFVHVDCRGTDVEWG